MMLQYYAITLEGYYKVLATHLDAAYELAPAGSEMSLAEPCELSCLGVLKERSIIAIDIETDGLNHVGGQILEVCLHKLDAHLNIVATFKGVLPFNTTGFSDFIRDMHTKNGLIRAEATTTLQDLEKWIRQYENIVWLGSSVQFDKAWVEHHIPNLAVNHRVIDVSSMKGLVDLSNRLPDSESDHRAESDICYSLELARLYRDVLEFGVL